MAKRKRTKGQTTIYTTLQRKMYKLYMSSVIPWLLPEHYLFLLPYLARLTRIDGRLPRLDSLFIGQCIVQENGVYHVRQVSVHKCILILWTCTVSFLRVVV
jgi:hypothetical protein